ncbi:hypothetical protein MKW92_018077, partial [Papaver armeniacum]
MEAYMKDYYYTYFNEPEELNTYYVKAASITTYGKSVDVERVASRLTTDKVKPTKFAIKALDAVPVKRDDYKGDIMVTVMGCVESPTSSYLCNQ